MLAHVTLDTFARWRESMRTCTCGRCVHLDEYVSHLRRAWRNCFPWCSGGTPSNLPPRRPEDTFDDQYLQLLRKIRLCGIESVPSRGPCVSVYGHSIEVDVSAFVPLLSLRRLAVRKLLVEALWCLCGSQHITFLRQWGNRWWDAEADSGDWVGLSYGLLTNFPNCEPGLALNQFQRTLRALETPTSSRNLVMSLVHPAVQKRCEACISIIQLHTIRCDNRWHLDISVSNALRMWWSAHLMISQSFTHWCGSWCRAFGIRSVLTIACEGYIGT